MLKLRSTYNGRLIHKTSYEGRKDFFRYDSLVKSYDRLTQYSQICLRYSLKNFRTFKVTIVSRSYDKRTIILRYIVRYFVNRVLGLEVPRHHFWSVLILVLGAPGLGYITARLSLHSLVAQHHFVCFTIGL